MHFPSRLSPLAKPVSAAMSLTLCHSKVVPGQAAEQDTRQYHEARSREVAAAKAGAAAGKGPSPYPHKFSTTIGLQDYVQRHRELPGGLQLRDSEAAVAGRVILKRAASSKLVFYTVQGEGVQLQLMADLANSGMDAAAFVEAHATFKRGDIVGARGYVGTSMKGELSLWVQQMVLLAPCLHMLPKPAQNGTVAMTQEVRYRQRYLDGIVNPANVRRIFTTRARVVQFVRRYLDDRGYLEVETPVLQQLPGGASARPFVTYHNDLQQQLYLRIATELPLKQLVVGGLDRVYEIGRLFRNEGIDLTHNPEFTSCEGYQAHADYTDMMVLMEGMISQMVLEVTGSYRLQYHAHGPSKPATEINFEPPWRRIDMISGLEEALGVSFPTDLASAETQRLLDSLCAQHQVDCGAPRSADRLLDKLAAAFLEVQLVDPGFICHQPLLMSPLAKEHPSKAGLAERFELFVNQRELVNAFSELNDPDVQRERFLEQAKAKAAGDAEAMQLDEDFCASLEYGLPPTGGFGLGIDRLTMLLTDCTNIKEVLLFPALRPVMQSAGVTASGSA